VLGPDLIAEEARRLAGGVRDQGLGRRQLQLQLIAQERRYPRLDFLCLVPGACEPQEPVDVADEFPVARAVSSAAAPLRACAHFLMPLPVEVIVQR
jgi:hypothetical protein